MGPGSPTSVATSPETPPYFLVEVPASGHIGFVVTGMPSSGCCSAGAGEGIHGLEGVCTPKPSCDWSDWSSELLTPAIPSLAYMYMYHALFLFFFRHDCLPPPVFHFASACSSPTHPPLSVCPCLTLCSLFCGGVQIATCSPPRARRDRSDKGRRDRAPETRKISWRPG